MPGRRWKQRLKRKRPVRAIRQGLDKRGCSCQFIKIKRLRTPAVWRAQGALFSHPADTHLHAGRTVPVWAIEPRIAVEAGSTDGWYKYVGLEGRVIGLDRFGESAPAGELFQLFGLTAEVVAERARRVLAKAAVQEAA